MGGTSMYLVDLVQVAAEDVAAYLEAVSSLAVPTMTAAGAELESCRSTDADLGLDVDVELVWRFPDVAAWNVIRRNLVLDPGWYEWARRSATLRRSGIRRFMVDNPVLAHRAGVPGASPGERRRP